jgi:TRAP-type C4-dicarboxylate transport system substrate-binding protein
MALYNSLPKEDQKALDKAWDAQLPVSLIVKALRQEGYKTSQDTVRAHKKGECKCPK